MGSLVTAFNLVTATVNLVTATVILVTATVDLVTATVDLVTATINLVTATVNLVTATVNLVTATGPGRRRHWDQSAGPASPGRGPRDQGSGTGSAPARVGLWAVAVDLRRPPVDSGGGRGWGEEGARKREGTSGQERGPGGEREEAAGGDPEPAALLRDGDGVPPRGPRLRAAAGARRLRRPPGRHAHGNC